MGSFILHILFSGLILFVPNQNNTSVDVVLLNVGDCQHLSDGTALSQHKPLLLARGGSCTGQCPTTDSTVAQYLYADQSASVAADSLAAAVSGGGAWQLSGSQLSLRKGSTNAAALPGLTIASGRASSNGQPLPIPTTSAEREDFDWVASLGQVCPTCTLNTDILASQPPSGLVAARFHITSGKVFTYSVARIGTDVTPVHFQRLDGQGSVSGYSQAVANWVGTDVEVTGDSIDIVEEKFNGDPGRTMHLTPDSNGRIEVAVLNLPPFAPPVISANPQPGIGKHFEMFYDLASNAPSQASRVVPVAGAASSVGSYPQVSWSSIHPKSTLGSTLLEKLRLDAVRSADDPSLCPPSKWP